MDFGAVLRSFIYVVSNTLLYPTLLLESVLIVWLLIYSGMFLGEWLGRGRLRRVSPFELAQLTIQRRIRDECSYQVRSYLGDVLGAVERKEGISEPEVERLLQERSADAWKSLDHLRILVRVGPGLGLIGTLIPMGTGLAALGQGDITKLSTDLVVAFTTTVVGLAIGLSAYVFYWKRRRWVEEDIRQMEFITETLVNHRQSEECQNEIHASTKIPRSSRFSG